MQTKVYCERNRYNTKQWWWCEIGNSNPSHGPFPSRDEARDAASAARITAKAEQQDKLLTDTVNILNAG